MSLTYKDLFEVHTKYIEFLIAKTYLLHQYVNNTNATGSEVEYEIRKFLSEFIPERFKVTHGYICRALNHIDEPLVSPQLDCIIVDTLVPHSLFPLSYHTGQEVVPYESVVGIIEIKRTLNNESFKNSISHIKSTLEKLQIDKSDQTQYILSGLKSPDITTGIFSNPLIAILAIDHEFSEEYLLSNEQNIFENCDKCSVDLVGSLNGLMICPIDTLNNNSFKITPFKEPNLTYGFATKEQFSSSGLISRIIGFVVAYLSMTTGKYNPMGNYLFHRSTFYK